MPPPPSAPQPTLGDVLHAVARPTAQIHVLNPTGALQTNVTHPPLVAPAHHNYYELAVCHAGAMSFIGYANTLGLKTGDAIIIKPGAWHYESYRRINQPYRICWLIPAPNMTNCIFTDYRRGTFRVIKPVNSPPLDATAVLNEIANEVTGQRLHWHTQARALLMSLLVEVDRRAQTMQPARRPQPDPVSALLRIVQARFRDQLQIKSLAKDVGLSPDHLSRRFYATCGTTFKDYLNTIRIHHAQSLLKRGWSIKEAAAESGFSDVYYFNRVFKQHCQTTPGKFVRNQ